MRCLYVALVVAFTPLSLLAGERVVPFDRWQAKHEKYPGIKNRGGSDGLGLCVFTSIEWAARMQGVHKLYGLQDFMTRRPGGGWPSKVDQIFKAYKADVKYLHFVDTSPREYIDLMRECLEVGIYPSITWGGDMTHYRGMRIDHMVSLVDLNDEEVGILDNNFVHEVLYVDSPTAFRRMAMGTTTNSYFWAVVVYEGSAVPKVSGPPQVVGLPESDEEELKFGVEGEYVLYDMQTMRGIVGNVAELLEEIGKRRDKTLVCVFGDVVAPRTEQVKKYVDDKLYLVRRQNTDWLVSRLGISDKVPCVVAFTEGKVLVAKDFDSLVKVLQPDLFGGGSTLVNWAAFVVVVLIFVALLANAILNYYRKG